MRVLEGRGKIWGDQDMEKNGRKMLKKKFKDSKGFRKISNLVCKKEKNLIEEETFIVRKSGVF